MKRKRTRNSPSTLSIFSIPNYYIKKGRPHGHCYGKKEGDHEYFIANQLKKKCKKREFLSIHDRFIHDEKFRKNTIELGRNEELCREIDKLANKDHTHHISPDQIRVYRNNWWIRWNTVSSDTMPVRHRADFKSLNSFATAQESKGSSLLPKLVVKLFLVMVEPARFLVASFT